MASIRLQKHVFEVGSPVPVWVGKRGSGVKQAALSTLRHVATRAHAGEPFSSSLYQQAGGPLDLLKAAWGLHCKVEEGDLGKGRRWKNRKPENPVEQGDPVRQDNSRGNKRAVS